jgi:hypothetical protein
MIPVLETLILLRKKLKVLNTSKEQFINYTSQSIPPRPMNYNTILSINKKMLSNDRMQAPDLEAGPNSCAIQSPQS